MGILEDIQWSDADSSGVLATGKGRLIRTKFRLWAFPLALACSSVLASCAGVDLSTGLEESSRECTPQSGQTITFGTGDWEWDVTDSGTIRQSPGPNFYSSNNVRVDERCRLHLTIAESDDGRWMTAGREMDGSAPS